VEKGWKRDGKGVGLDGRVLFEKTFSQNNENWSVGFEESRMGGFFLGRPGVQ
jgi:hypothetical protein